MLIDFLISNFIRINFGFLNSMPHRNKRSFFHLQKLQENPPLPVYSQPSSPCSCSQQLTASPPCAIGASYQGRPRPRGVWACSRVHCATAPRAVDWGAVRWAAGWWGWGHGWSAHGDTYRCSTWIRWSRLSRSLAPGLEPATGWSAGRTGSPGLNDVIELGLVQWDWEMVRRQKLPCDCFLQLDNCFFCPHLEICVQMLFLFSDLEETVICTMN